MTKTYQVQRRKITIQKSVSCPIRGFYRGGQTLRKCLEGDDGKPCKHYHGIDGDGDDIGVLCDITTYKTRTVEVKDV